MSSQKNKVNKANIYPQVYNQLVKGKEFEQHGLSYAVNAELSRSYGIEPPKTPAEQMGEASSKKSQTKNLRIPSNWLDLLVILNRNGTWHRKDYLHFSIICEKSELVTFIKKRGAQATDKLRSILRNKNFQLQIENLLEKTATAAGYKLDFSSDD